MLRRTVVVVFAWGMLGAEPAPPRPPLRAIPGLTAADPFPRGCVDCHINRTDIGMDVRLSTLVHSWQTKVDPALLAKVRRLAPPGMKITGKHPVVESFDEIPDTCLRCHAENSPLAPPFARLLHALHLVGGDKNHFMTLFQGECTHCHKLDRVSGSWSLGHGSEK